MRSEDEEVFVSRVFECANGEVRLSFYKPQPYPKPKLDADPTNPPWRCFYSIRFPDGETVRQGVVGIDGMQSFLLAVASAQGALRHAYNGTPERAQIRWLGEDDLGLTINHFE